jgi:hypothetical protein
MYLFRSEVRPALPASLDTCRCIAGFMYTASLLVGPASRPRDPGADQLYR